MSDGFRPACYLQCKHLCTCENAYLKRRLLITNGGFGRQLYVSWHFSSFLQYIALQSEKGKISSQEGYKMNAYEEKEYATKLPKEMLTQRFLMVF